MIANRWTILAILFLARFSLGFQFQTTGTLAPELMSEFAIDYSGIGLLVGLFMLPGIALSVPAGFAGYWWGDARSVLTGLIFMTVGGIISGAGETIGVVMFGRLLSGAGAVCLFVMLSKVVMDHFDYRTLLFAMSIFVLGWPVGIAAGQATQTTIADFLSWREVFYLSSGLCFLSFMLFFLLTLLDRSQHQAQANLVDRDSGAWTQVNLSRSEFFWINVAGVVWMCLNGAYVVLVTFGPVYLMELDIGAVEAAVWISMISWAFIIGLPVGGYLAYRHNLPNTVMVVGLVASIVCGLSCSLFRFGPMAVCPLRTCACFCDLGNCVVASSVVEQRTQGNRTRHLLLLAFRRRGRAACCCRYVEGCKWNGSSGHTVCISSARRLFDWIGCNLVSARSMARSVYLPGQRCSAPAPRGNSLRRSAPASDCCCAGNNSL